MEALETLAVALGFASLAGVNLYLTVLITGLAVNQNLIDLSSKYPELMVLGEPVVLIAAAGFALVEFCSDKIPWVDSAWDSVHTLIRPVGGSVLALTALGPTDPALGVVVAMLAGGTSLMTHGMKAGTRLAINQSPEPVSNITMSLTEDMAVLGGLALMSLNPFIFAAICLLFLTMAAIMAPKLFRRTKAYSWLLRRKFSSIFRKKAEAGALLRSLSIDEEIPLKRLVHEQAEVRWSHPVILGAKRKFSGLTPHTFGTVYSLKHDPGALHFVGRRNWKHYHSRISLDHLNFSHESRFACREIVLEDRKTDSWLTMRLPVGCENVAERMITEMGRTQIAPPHIRQGIPESALPVPVT